ncbi:MAG: HEAT repeat domain-containing protein [Candidatus Tectomicrobia bacterium]
MGDEAASVRHGAAASLGQLGQDSPEVVAGLIDVLQNADSWIFRRDSAHLLGQTSLVTDSVIFALWRGLLDSDNQVRTSCAQSLALLGRRFPDMAETIATKLVQAIQEQEFDKPDTSGFSRRTGHDYAFDGLWLLVEGGSL